MIHFLLVINGSGKHFDQKVIQDMKFHLLFRFISIIIDSIATKQLTKIDVNRRNWLEFYYSSTKKIYERRWFLHNFKSIVTKTKYNRIFIWCIFLV